MINKVTREQIVLLYNDGKTSVEVAKEMNCSPTTVCKIARQNGIQVRQYGWIKQNEKAGIITSHLSGMSVDQIANHYKHGQTTIRKILKDASCQLKIYKKSRYLEPREIDKAIKLYYEGSGIRNIAEDMDCGYSYLRNMFIKRGVKIRTKHEATSLVFNKRNPNWGLGRKKVAEGYIEVWAPNHPKANKKGYIREHILVWEKAHGDLALGYVIHHLNGIKDDNRLKNLTPLPKRIHDSGHLRHGRLKDAFIRKLQRRIRDLELASKQLF